MSLFRKINRHYETMQKQLALPKDGYHPAKFDHTVLVLVASLNIPEFVAKRWWHHLVHNQTAIALKAMLFFKRGKVVTSIRYHLNE